MLASTSLQIAPATGPERLDEIVAATVDDLSRAQHVDLHTNALKAYGAAAVPGLLRCLSDAARRNVALYALQHCWSPEARAPVAELLKDADSRARHMAAIVLAKNEGVAGLARLCQPLLDDPRPEIAGFAYERIEAEAPSFSRTKRFIEDPRMWDYLWKFLPRYESQQFTPRTREMIEKGSLPAALAAIICLIHQNDDSEDTRRRMVEILASDPLAVAREFAAEYLMWHGTAEETASLRECAAKEQDEYAAAAMREAYAAIERRTAHTSRGRGVGEGTEAFEPFWAFKGAPPPEKFVAQRQSFLALQARQFAIPTQSVLYGEERPEKTESEFSGKFAGKPATALMPPVRDYFDPKRESYGKTQEKEIEGFGGMIHVADDVGWHRDHLTVVAIADGLVRHVSCLPSWGYMVIIEHHTPRGEIFCSLYAHLSPFVCVFPSQYVAKGRKIGSIGRSLTWENGGYLAHLHFGIHLGPYWQVFLPGVLIDVRYEGKMYTGKVVNSTLDGTTMEIHTPRGAYIVRRPTSWIAGYLSKAFWEQKRHQWVNPQEFLKQPME